jgi:hypothetical protein
MKLGAMIKMEYIELTMPSIIKGILKTNVLIC